MAKSKFNDEVLAAFKDNPHFNSVWVAKDGKTWWSNKLPGTTEVTRQAVSADLKVVDAANAVESK